MHSNFASQGTSLLAFLPSVRTSLGIMRALFAKTAANMGFLARFSFVPHMAPSWLKVLASTMISSRLSFEEIPRLCSVEPRCLPPVALWTC